MSNILSLTGGGFMGYFTIQVIEALAEEYNSPNLDQVDFFAGTSIGGILSLALAAGIPPSTILQAFLDHRKNIFKKSKIPGVAWSKKFFFTRYSSKGLSEAIERILGDKAQMRLGELQRDVMVTAVKLSSAQSVQISTMNEETQEWKLVDAALATSAAPTYFPAHVPSHMHENARYVDGGMSCNMPDIEALTHFGHYAGFGLNEMYLLSIGTCYSPESQAAYQSLEGKGGQLSWKDSFVPFFMDGQRNLILEQCETLMPQGHYHRIDATLESHQEIDDVSEEAVLQLQKCAKRVDIKKPAIEAFFNAPHL